MCNIILKHICLEWKWLTKPCKPCEAYTRNTIICLVEFILDDHKYKEAISLYVNTKIIYIYIYRLDACSYNCS